MNLSELLKDIEHWTGLNNISSTPSLKSLFVNLLNRRYEEAMAMTGAASRLSGIDDTNYPTQPFSFFDINLGQNDYEFLFDEDGNSITDITAVLLKTGDEFVKLTKLTLDNDEAEKIMSCEKSGIPTAYIERNNSIFFNVNPNFSKEKGGKLFYKRVPSYFTIDDDDKSPGFNSEHHRILSLGASLDWILVNKSNAQTLISRLELKLAKMEDNFKVYSEMRNPVKRRLTFKRESSR